MTAELGRSVDMIGSFSVLLRVTCFVTTRVSSWWFSCAGFIDVELIPRWRKVVSAGSLFLESSRSIAFTMI